MIYDVLLVLDTNNSFNNVKLALSGNNILMHLSPFTYSNLNQTSK